MSETTINLLLSIAAGAIGGAILIPVNAIVAWILKRDEQQFGHQLQVIAKQQELLLQHKLELARSSQTSGEIQELRAAIQRLEGRHDHG